MKRLLFADASTEARMTTRKPEPIQLEADHPLADMTETERRFCYLHSCVESAVKQLDKLSCDMPEFNQFGGINVHSEALFEIRYELGQAQSLLKLPLNTDQQAWFAVHYRKAVVT